MTTVLRLAAIGAITFAPATPLAGLQGPPPVVREAIDATVAMIESDDEASLQRYADDRLDRAYRTRLGDGLLAHLAAIRDAARGADDEISVERVDDDLMLRLSGERVVLIRLRLDESSGRATLLEVVERGEASAPSGPGEALGHRMRALEDFGATGDATTFTAEHLDPGLRARLGEGLGPLLDSIADVVGTAMDVSANPHPQGAALAFRGGSFDADVVIGVAEEAPHRITLLRLETDVEPLRDPTGPELPPLTWDALPGILEAAEADGFSGTVLAVRDGRRVVERGYGLADREAARPNDLETVFDLGSLPFDFTAGAILRLVETGQLDLDAPIDRFFPDVPEDKRSMTVRHLFEHRSGLPNFHGRSVDDDQDLSWIDREEAERRILESRLLSEPGAERVVSHSAYGLLAALVERVSGRSYGDYLREEFFDPAGMERTGFYGEDLGLPVSEFAVGYGVQAADPNIPPNWGPASWLVLGSGGMVSTVGDLRRWFDFVRTSGVLTGERLDAFRRPFVIGGSERGFLGIMTWDLEDSTVYLLSNSGGPGTLTDALVRGIVEMMGGTLSGGG